MNDEDIISFTQFTIDRLYGHSLTDQIIRNTLSDWRRTTEDKTPEEIEEWHDGKRQMEEDQYRDEQ